MPYSLSQDPNDFAAMLAGEKEKAKEKKERQQFDRKKAQEERNIAMGLNPDGSPKFSEWGDQGSVVDEEGNLLPQYALEAGVADPSSVAGYGQFEEFATGTEQSPWAAAAMDKLGATQQAQTDEEMRRSQGRTAQVESQLAMRGGLSSGARERVATGGASDLARGQQGIRRSGLMAGKDISMQDAAAKQAALGKFVDLGTSTQQFNIGQQTAADKFNIGAKLGELASKREFGQRREAMELEKFGAEKKAAGMEKQASCFAAGTLIKMKDGSDVKIEDLKIGDITEKGGRITAAYMAENRSPIFLYEGVYVTGSHPVYENDKWVRVKDSALAIPALKRVGVVFDVSNEGHLLLINGHVFSDYAEVDNGELSMDDMLSEMNSKL